MKQMILRVFLLSFHFLYVGPWTFRFILRSGATFTTFDRLALSHDLRRRFFIFALAPSVILLDNQPVLTPSRLILMSCRTPSGFVRLCTVPFVIISKPLH